MMKNIEENEALSLLDLKGKIDVYESKRTVELSFDLDEKICKMLEKMAEEQNKSEEDIINELVYNDYLKDENTKNAKR